MSSENLNMKYYEVFKAVPDLAKKKIEGGRLKGFTDINPMWRIKKLTEVFGPVGKGWYTELIRWEIKEGADGEQVAFVDINLYVKFDNEWSKPIFGTGGSSFISKERSGLYTSDEAFKMAYTDALSVSCKALGIGADVYFEKDRSKYDNNSQSPVNKGQGPDVRVIDNTSSTNGKALSDKQITRLYAIAKTVGIDKEKADGQVKTKFNKEVAQLTKEEYDAVCKGYEGIKK